MTNCIVMPAIAALHDSKASVAQKSSGEKEHRKVPKWSELHVAVVKEDLQRMKVLLKSGVNVNCTTPVKLQTPARSHFSFFR